MAGSHANRKPTFFWQGTLIVLPVVLLSVFSMLSLRRDEQAVESEARKRAAENADSLARALRSQGEAEVARFMALGGQGVDIMPGAEWPEGVDTNGRPTGRVSADPAAPELTRWERDYPGVRPAELALPSAWLSADGREVRPAPAASTPVPPEWFRVLRGEQERRWQDLRRQQAAGAGPQVLQAAYAAFLDSRPTEAGVSAARCLMSTPEELLKGPRALVPSESGIAFQAVACYQLLRGTNPFCPPLLEMLRRLVLEEPSFVSPALLDRAEAATNHADALTCDTVRRLREQWLSQERVRSLLENLCEQLPPEQWGGHGSNWFWVSSEGSEALALLASKSFEAEPGKPAAPGWEVSLVPRQAIEAIFSKALAEHAYLLPRYAAASVELEGRMLAGQGLLTPAPGPPILDRKSTRLNSSHRL